MPLDVIAKLMFSILFLMSLGYLLCKKGVLDTNLSKKFSYLLLNVVTPLNMIAVANTRYNPALVGQIGFAMLIMVIFYTVGYGLILPAVKGLQVPQKQKGSFANLIMLSNISFVGMPIVLQLFGNEGGIFAIVCALCFIVASYTIGLKCIGEKLTLRQFFTKPMTLLPVLSLVLFISPVRLPEIVVYPMQQIGAMAGPLAMFVTGAAMARTKFSSLFTNRWAWVVCFVRHLALPGVLAFALYLVGFKGVLPSAIVLLCGMPSATTNVIFAEEYNCEILFTSRTVVLSTVLMLASLPLHIWLCVLLFG